MTDAATTETTAEKKLIAFVTLSLDSYLTATPNVTSEEWALLDGTFEALDSLVESDRRARQMLSDLHSFCRASQETKECIARAALTYQFSVDNHLLLLMDTSKVEPTHRYTPQDIIGFVLSRKGRDTLHITYCTVKDEFRRKRMGTNMIRSLRHTFLNQNTGIMRITTDAWPSVEAVSFFVALGFVPHNASCTAPLKEILATQPGTLWTDERLVSIRSPSNMISLVYYSPLCRTCKDTTKKTRKCGQCHTVAYCSSKCQSDDWYSHKSHCVTTTTTTIPNK